MNKRILSLVLLVLVSSALKAQLATKIQEIFSNDIFFVQLKDIQAKVQGEAKDAIPRFLETTMKNPLVITPEKMAYEKERYYSLCNEYNEIIEDIIGTIRSLEKIKDLREVDLFQYRDRIDALGPKFDAFFKDLSKYHKEASIVSILLDIYKLGKPVIQHLIQERIETIKRVLIEQLRSLKLVPVPWEPAEAVVRQRVAPASGEEVRAKIGLAASDHYRSLNLAPGVSAAQISEACKTLKTDYAAEISGSSNPEIKEFFQQLTARVDAAQKYFEANPPETKRSSPVQDPKTSTNAGGCAELKGEINGLMQAAEYMTKEQLVEKIKQTVSKY